MGTGQHVFILHAAADLPLTELRSDDVADLSDVFTGPSAQTFSVQADQDYTNSSVTGRLNANCESLSTFLIRTDSYSCYFSQISGFHCWEMN